MGKSIYLTDSERFFITHSLDHRAMAEIMYDLRRIYDERRGPEAIKEAIQFKMED